MLSIHSLASISHFAKFRKNRQLTASEMVRNLLKYPIPQWRRKWKSDPHVDPDLRQKITSKGSPTAHDYHVWSASVTTTASYPAHR